jgi:hypothetical protein
LVRNSVEDVNVILSPQKSFVNVADAAEDYSSRKRECKEKVNRKRERKRKLGLGIILKPSRLHN